MLVAAEAVVFAGPIALMAEWVALLAVATLVHIAPPALTGPHTVSTCILAPVGITAETV